MIAAGLDGIELEAYGHLMDQFWSPLTNTLEAPWGGALDNRLRFTREAISAIRAQVPGEFIVGMRMSGDEHDEDGMVEDDSVAIARALAPELDYLNVIEIGRAHV